MIKHRSDRLIQPFDVLHTSRQLNELSHYLNSLDGDARVVMERIGRYHEPMAHALHQAGIFYLRALAHTLPNHFPHFNPSKLKCRFTGLKCCHGKFIHAFRPRKTTFQPNGLVYLPFLCKIGIETGR